MDFSCVYFTISASYFRKPMRILAKCGTLERRRATRKKTCASDLCENAAPKRLSDATECAGKHPK